MATAEPTSDTKATNGFSTEQDKQERPDGKHVAANGTSDKSHYKIPDAKTLQTAGELKIKDENGEEITFKSLYEDQAGKQLIVFIRHFYCGHCEEYVRALVRSLPPSTLATTNPPTTLKIIGCGEIVCMPDYKKRTMSALDKPYALYSDRSRQLYETLDMVCNLQMSEKKPEYITTGLTSNVVSSLKNIVVSGSKGLKGGNYSQNGGEWLFKGGELKWCRRMRNTGDHAEVAELKEVLGMS